MIVSSVTENDVPGNSGRRGPQLLVDSRIYLTFLAVPLIICFIRIFWVFVYKKYCKQPQRRNINRRSVSTNSDASESSEASDDDSMTSSLAHPPPSYSDLFGTTHPARVFAISRGSLVRQCSKCQHYTDFGASSAIFSTGPSPADELAMTSGNDGSGAAGTRVPASDITSGETIVYSGDPSEHFDQGGISGFNPQLAVRADQEHPGWVHTAAQSGASVAPPPLPQLVATDTCPCACHTGGHDNLAFVCSSPADGAGGVPHPGMHMPLFSRVDSDTSFRSVTDSLPDYDQALEILKKSHDVGRSEDSCV
ncbi:hypothetical protein C0Q70_01403 [Pomacea canaliculata]|uniref:Uncharacterized protein n=1 Tax=Pomacea canaliculata TaxID=400727 RepID=A0A2T7PZF3_POMCA|nr:hypothetical protein C0Q70_01403 [Pomacea canaliculata]